MLGSRSQCRYMKPYRTIKVNKFTKEVKITIKSKETSSQLSSYIAGCLLYKQHGLLFVPVHESTIPAGRYIHGCTNYSLANLFQHGLL